MCDQLISSNQCVSDDKNLRLETITLVLFKGAGSDILVKTFHQVKTKLAVKLSVNLLLYGIL